MCVRALSAGWLCRSVFFVPTFIRWPYSTRSSVPPNLAIIGIDIGANDFPTPLLDMLQDFVKAAGWHAECDFTNFIQDRWTQTWSEMPLFVRCHEDLARRSWCFESGKTCCELFRLPNARVQQRQSAVLSTNAPPKCLVVSMYLPRHLLLLNSWPCASARSKM